MWTKCKNGKTKNSMPRSARLLELPLSETVTKALKPNLSHKVLKNGMSAERRKHSARADPLQLSTIRSGWGIACSKTMSRPDALWRQSATNFASLCTIFAEATWSKRPPMSLDCVPAWLCFHVAI